MAIEVEDGTGKANAVSYDTVANFKAYHAARGRTDVAAMLDAACEPALVRATDYLDMRFGRRFRGTRSSSTQALEYPRVDGVDNDGYLIEGIPRQLKKALYEYALISAHQGELAPNPPMPNGTQAVATGVVTAATGVSGRVTSYRSVVGPIEESRTYEQRADFRRTGTGSMVTPHNIPEYPLADSWVEELLRSTGSADIGFAG